MIETMETVQARLPQGTVPWTLHVCVLSMLLGFTSQGFGQKQRAAEILVKVELASLAIEDYVVDLEADVNMERIRMPRMQATMYFKSPDKVHFESPNFALLPREGFGLPVSVLVRRYDAFFKGEEELEGVKTVKLQLIARDPTLRIQQLFLWVDHVKHVIVKSETVPYQGRSVIVRFDYGLQANKFWLPVRLRAGFENVGPDTGGATFEVPTKPELQEFRRAPRRGSIEITYSNYRVNTGLTDEFFSRKDTTAQQERKE